MSTQKYLTPEYIKEVINDHKYKEAFYIYDLSVMNYKMDLLSILPENVKTFYAMKVNPHKDIVKNALKHKNIAGIEVASKGEINIALYAQLQGFVELESERLKKLGKEVSIDETIYNNMSKSLSRIIYTGPSKKDSEIEFSVKNNIKYLNVESWKEAILVNMEAEKRGIVQPILMRLNTKHKFEKGEAGVTLGSGDTQFGFPQDETIDYLKDLEKLENIKVDGFHMYPATGILEADVLLRSVDETFKFVKDIEKKTGRYFNTIDFGGGFGIDYGGFKEFNIEKYAEGLGNLIEKYDMKDKTLILELGRYLGADMGYFVTKINDIKTLSSGFKGVLCNAGTNAHKRPQVLEVDYHVDIVHVVDETTNKIIEIAKKLGRPIDKVDILNSFNAYGSFCTSADKIAWNKKGLEASMGDFLVMPQAGAYGKTMSPQAFLSHPEIEEIVIDKNYFENKGKITAGNNIL